MSAGKEAYLSFINKFDENNLSLYFEIKYLDWFIEKIKSHPISIIFLYNHDDFSQSVCSCLTQEFLNNINFLAWDVSNLERNKELVEEVKELNNENQAVENEMLLDCITRGRSTLNLFTFKGDRYFLTAYFRIIFNLTDLITECCNEQTGLSCDIFVQENSTMELSELYSLNIDFENNLQKALFRGEREKKLVLIYFHNEKELFSQNFCKVIRNRDANVIFSKYILCFRDRYDKEIKHMFDMLESRINLRTFNGLLVVQFDKWFKLRKSISGNINEQKLIIDLYDVHEDYENEQLKIMIDTEERVYTQAVEEFSAKFKNSKLSLEKFSLKNAFENNVTVEPDYLRKIVIVCMYTEKSNSIQKLFSSILNNDELKNQISLLYHIVLWKIDDDTNINLFKNATRDLHFDKTIIEVIDKKLEQKNDNLFLFQADDNKVTQLLIIINESEYNMCDLKTIFTIYSKSFTEKLDITDLFEAEATKNVPVCLEYEKIISVQPLRRVFYDLLVNSKPGDVIVLNFYIKKSALVGVLKSMPENTKLITWNTTSHENTEKLILAVDRHCCNDEIRKTIRKKDKNYFVFVSTGEGIVLLRDKKSLKNVLSMLSAFENNKNISALSTSENSDIIPALTAQESTPEKNSNETDPNICRSPFIFQQETCTKLCDRDYNQFDLESEKELELFNDWIGFALFGPPEEAETKYDEKKIKIITDMINKIKNQVEKYSPWPNKILVACVYNCFIPNKKGLEDFIPSPVIAIQKCVNSSGRSCRLYVDSDLRVYSSWENYLDKNNLPSGISIVPQDGIYQQDCFGKVRLEWISDLKIGSQIVNGLDKVSIGTGLGSGIVGGIALIPAVTFAPAILAVAAVAGIGTGIYSIGRSSASLADRSIHEQSLHIKDPQARAAYLNIITGACSFATFGATAAMSKMASSGKDIGRIPQILFNCLTGANITVSGINISNSVFDIIYNWKVNGETPDALTQVQLVASVLFFSHSIYSFKSAGRVINESQQQAIMDIENSLKSNRQRKTFNKLLKETVRVNEGNTQAGFKDVIYYIKNIDNADEIIATLTRSNKQLNKNNIRFAVEKNKVTFNGAEVNLNTFSELSNMEKSQVFKDIPSMREFQKIQKSDFNISDINYNTMAEVAVKTVEIVTKLYQQDYKILEREFSNVVIDIIKKIVAKFMDPDILSKSAFSLLMGGIKINSWVLQMIMDFFQTQGLAMLKEYLRENNHPNMVDAVCFVEKAIIVACLSIENLLRQLIAFSVTWVAKQMLEFSEGDENKETIADLCECNTCHGYVIRTSRFKRKHSPSKENCSTDSQSQ